MTEFELIARIRQRTASAHGVVLGIGDDAAVLAPQAGMEMVATTDTVLEGRHFRPGIDPADLGHLALAVNLSDLAAMGATARWSLMALTLPENNSGWLDQFLDGYLALADASGCSLVGGNIVRGPLSVTVTALGEVQAGQACTRRGACPGDRLVVTGTLGDAAAALELNQNDASPLGRRLVRPEPRLDAGAALAGRCRAMIDISDGLLADLKHLLGPLGAHIECAHLPASEALCQAIPDLEQRWRLQLTGGSDYELLAAVPPEVTLPKRLAGVPLTDIGEITASPDIRCATPDGSLIDSAIEGWDHFRSEDQDGS